MTDLEIDAAEPELSPENPEPGPRGWMLAIIASTVVAAIEILEHGINPLLFGRLSEVTHGFVSTDLLASLLQLSILAILLFGSARFRPYHFGIHPRAALAGLGIGLALWGLCQIILAIGGLEKAGLVRTYQGWSIDPLGTFLGIPRAAIGEALIEELFFRGYLLVWLVLELQARVRDKFFGTVVAILASQVVYAGLAIPGRVAAGIPLSQVPIEIVLIALTGIYYTILFIRTDNIFVPVVVHALSLWPAPLFDPTIDPARLVILISAVFLVIPARGDPDERRRWTSGVWD